MQKSTPRIDRAHVAIFLDLEMVRGFPTEEYDQWDYEKGNLDFASKEWATEAARRVAAAGGHLHGFVVGRTLEQESVTWLQGIEQAGHPLGNHTYDHVHLSAATTEVLQKRFERAPWLIRGRNVAEVLRENIQLCSVAMKNRLDVVPRGFRCPDDFPQALRQRGDLQHLLIDAGFQWVQSQYPSHPPVTRGQPPSEQSLRGIVEVIADAQPFVYESGLLEIPISPPSDIIAFRVGQWTLASYLKAIQMGVEMAIRERLVYVHLFHLGSIAAADPDFESIDLICQLVHQAGDRATLATGDDIASRFLAG